MQMYDINIRWSSEHKIPLERSIIAEKADFNYIRPYRDLDFEVKVMKLDSERRQIFDVYVC